MLQVQLTLAQPSWPIRTLNSSPRIPQSMRTRMAAAKRALLQGECHLPILQSRSESKRQGQLSPALQPDRSSKSAPTVNRFPSGNYHCIAPSLVNRPTKAGIPGWAGAGRFARAYGAHRDGRGIRLIGHAHHKSRSRAGPENGHPGVPAGVSCPIDTDPQRKNPHQKPLKANIPQAPTN